MIHTYVYTIYVYEWHSMCTIYFTPYKTATRSSCAIVGIIIVFGMSFDSFQSLTCASLARRNRIICLILLPSTRVFYNNTNTIFVG